MHDFWLSVVHPILYKMRVEPIKISHSKTMPRLNIDERNQAVGMLRGGASVREVSQAFQVHHTSIYRLLHRNQTTGTIADRPRSGTPRVTTSRQDRAIRRTHDRDRREKILGSLAKWFGKESTTEMIENTRNREMWRNMIADVCRQGT